MLDVVDLADCIQAESGGFFRSGLFSNVAFGRAFGDHEMSVAAALVRLVARCPAQSEIART